MKNKHVNMSVQSRERTRALANRHQLHPLGRYDLALDYQCGFGCGEMSRSGSDRAAHHQADIRNLPLFQERNGYFRKAFLLGFRDGHASRLELLGKETPRDVWEAYHIEELRRSD